MARNTSIETQAKFLSEHRAAWLLTLTIGGVTHRWTSWNVSLQVDAQDYAPRGIAFGGIARALELDMSPDLLEIDNVDLLLSGLFSAPQGDSTGARAALDLYAVDTAERIGIARGAARLQQANMRVAGVTVIGDLSPITTTLPKRTFGELCQWRFGDLATCAFTITGIKGELVGQTVDAGSSTSVVIDAARDEDGTYTGPGSFWQDGFVTVTTGAAAGQVRRIVSSASGSITLELPLSIAPAEGDTYTVVRGCDRTFRTCEGRFSNTDLYGGFVNFPRRVDQ